MSDTIVDFPCIVEGKVCNKKNGKSNGKSNGNGKILYLSSMGYLHNILRTEIDSLIELQSNVVNEIDKVIQKIGGLTNERE